MKWSCKKMEWKGLPCADMFHAIVMENMKSIPESCLLKRLTFQAREKVENEVLVWRQGMYNELVQTARYRTLTLVCKKMCYFASHMEDGFARVRAIATNQT